jgi:hypothetical protein
VLVREGDGHLWDPATRGITRTRFHGHA